MQKTEAHKKQHGQVVQLKANYAEPVKFGISFIDSHLNMRDT